MIWDVQSPQIPTTHQELLEILLKNRGLSASTADAFLSPKRPLDLTPSEAGLQQKTLETVREFFEKARHKKKRILVFGDYDADGICATAILWEALHASGCEVMPFIPDRERHGYGLSERALNEIFEDPPDVLVTVDNGIVAHAAFQRLKDSGIQTVLTDHHQPEEALPPADVIVHTTQLCGATVAWMVARAVNPQAAKKSLDLCGLATIADQVPLLGANRCFAKHGLEAIRRTTRPGLAELIHLAALDRTAIDTYMVNFALAPRINAMGRLKNALDALRLVCTTNEEKAAALAQNMQATNQERQDMTWSLLELARAQQQKWEQEHIIIVSGESFHDGVIGLIAGKLSEEFYKPAIVINQGERTAKASARSIPGVNIIELIRKTKHLLLEAGGHPMAAGFSLETQNIPEFTQLAQRLAKQQIAKTTLLRRLAVACVIPPTLLTREAVRAINQLEPFGVGNPRPVIGLQNLQIEDLFFVGKERQHLKLVLRSNDSVQHIHAIGFGMGNEQVKLEKGQQVNLAGILQENIWKNSVDIQIVIKDIVQFHKQSKKRG